MEMLALIAFLFALSHIIPGPLYPKRKESHKWTSD